MAKNKIDARTLLGSLDQARQSRDLSWRQLAVEAGVTPSLLSRIRNGYKPDADGFMTLVSWLGMPAERFLVDGQDRHAGRPPELTSELVPLLRASKDLDDNDIEMLQNVVQATLRSAAARRRERST